MLNPIENCFSTFKAMVKRVLARHRQAILEVPPHRTIKEHRKQYLLLAADLLLEEAITPGRCHRPTVDKLGLDVALSEESALNRKADGSTGMTTHRASAALRLLDFSHTRVCMQDFRVAKTLLFPIILDRDFMRDQKMILKFETGVIEWDGITSSMKNGKGTARVSTHTAVLQADTECRAEIQVEDHLPTPLEGMTT
ncbi:Gag-pol fusion protein [Phytophthora cinnamomi]|uniref:Gag-pol fusion protein n=1 Tax=Phytophthora cinnamomi TaxID=4785 RepID=UPI00355A336E|nr:Gag-pol fusion protein [Phytophthora cinnamomi]